jgi:hypothetical protein
MRAKLLLMLLIAGGLWACKNSTNNSACGMDVCTAEFATLGIEATNGTDSLIYIKDLKIINKRTNKAVKLPLPPSNAYYAPNYMLIADDNTKGEFSTGGDDIEITATNKATNQTKTITLKISGGCNCHVAKVSGPDKMVFD